MSEDSPYVNPNIRTPISEQLQSQNEQLGDKAISLVRDKEYLDSASKVEKILNPAHWVRERRWEEASISNAEQQDALAKAAEAHLPELHGEALDYVAAYKAYVEAGAALCEDLGIENVIPAKIEKFIGDIDWSMGENKDSPYWGKYWSKGVVFPEDPEERSAFFEKEGKILAIKDILVPQLPFQQETTEDGYRAWSDLPGTDEYVADAGSRFPRLQITSEAPSESQGEYLIEFSTDLSLFPAISDAQKRYVPASERVKQIISSVENEISGETYISGKEKVEFQGRMATPRGSIKYELHIVTQGEATSPEQQAA